jgi:hypothetical protein
MSYKLSFGLLIPIVAVMELIITNVPHRGGTQIRKLEVTAFPSPDGCLSNNEASAAFRVLAFGKYDEQQKAVGLLKANADRSTACRNQIIAGLMSAMDQRGLDLTGGTPQFYLWHYGTELLGELKAVEAIDLLIAHFDLNDGSGFPLNHYPALGGVIDMGEIALPKLETALMVNPDRYIRRHIVFCIAQIGGQFADQILRRAAEHESDPCVSSCILATLSEFNNKKRPHYISDVGRTIWYTTFLCNGQ